MNDKRQLLQQLMIELDEVVADTQMDKNEKFEATIQKVADYYSHIYETEKDEIAIFLVDKDVSYLYFVYPPYLVDSKKISLNSKVPVVSRLFNENDSILDNKYLFRERLYQYEFIKNEENESRIIWKIMGVVIIDDGEKLGVIQVSRKRSPYHDVGKNFTPFDLDFLKNSISLLAPYIKRYQK